MSHEFRLSSEFPFATGTERQFSYLAENDIHIKVEAPTHGIAREIGYGLAEAMKSGPCTAAKVAALGYISQANEREIPLSCSLTFSLDII